MTTKLFPSFKKFDAQFVAGKKRLELPQLNPSLEQPFSYFVGLPDELIHAVILLSGIFAKSTLAQLCKKIYFMIDLQLELKMYNASWSLLRRQDFQFKIDLEKWFMNSLVLRGCAFDDMEYFRAGLASENYKISTNPFVKKINKRDMQISFSVILESNSVAIFDYFVKKNEGLEKQEGNRPWKYCNNQDFQSFLWISVSSLANRLVVNSMPVKIVKDSIVDRIMLFASKYSYILLRIILAHPGSLSVVNFPALPSGSVAEFLSDLLQHQAAYPFDLTGVYSESTGLYGGDYTIPPLELCSHHGHLDLFKILVQYTPVLPNIAYLAYLGLIKTSSVRVADLIEEFYNHGADVNATVVPALRKKAKTNYLQNFFVDSALGVARFAIGYRVQPFPLVEWLLARGAKFSDFEMSQIKERTDLTWLTEDYRRVISAGSYVPLSKPIINWQGPKQNMYWGGMSRQMRLLDCQAWFVANTPNLIFFEVDTRNCKINMLGKGEEFKGTWSSNESDNVVTFDAPPFCLKYYAFSAFNGTTFLVSEEHLARRGTVDTITWLSGLLADNSWMKAILWNAEEIQQSLLEWLAKPSQRLLLFTTPTAKLEQHIQTGKGDPGSTAGQLGHMFVYTLKEAVAARFERSAPASVLYRSFAYTYWGIRIRRNLFRKLAPGRKSVVFLRDLALALAFALALGLWNEAADLAAFALEGLEDKTVHPAPDNSMASFILRLYCAWKQLPEPSTSIMPRDQLAGYAALLDVWNDPSASAAVCEALHDASVLHTALSHDNDDETTFDFSEEAYRIYPVEILAVLRLRQLLGFETQLPTHPLLQTPLAELHPIEPLAPDAFLTGVIAHYARFE